MIFWPRNLYCLHFLSQLNMYFYQITEIFIQFLNKNDQFSKIASRRIHFFKFLKVSSFALEFRKNFNSHEIKKTNTFLYVITIDSFFNYCDGICVYKIHLLSSARGDTRWCQRTDWLANQRLWLINLLLYALFSVNSRKMLWNSDFYSVLESLQYQKGFCIRLTAVDRRKYVVITVWTVRLCSCSLNPVDGNLTVHWVFYYDIIATGSNTDPKSSSSFILLI